MKMSASIENRWQSWAVLDCYSWEEAYEAVTRLAVKDGWRMRKWYEFWRWNEHSYSHLKLYYDKAIKELGQ